jgi:hypothetical protein
MGVEFVKTFDSTYIGYDAYWKKCMWKFDQIPIWNKWHNQSVSWHIGMLGLTTFLIEMKST